MDRIDMLKNLMVMAAADGRFDASELEMLSDRCTLWGLTPEQFAEAIEYATTANAELKIPSDKQEREELIQNLVRIMAADGQLNEMEKELFAMAAATMELTMDELNQLIDDVLSDDLPPQ